MIQLTLPAAFETEQKWICSVIFNEILGVPYSSLISGARNYIISHDNHTLTLPDVFFSRAEKVWCQPSTLLDSRLDVWDVSSSGLDAKLTDNAIPVLFGQPGFQLDQAGNGNLRLDVIGSAFFMLSRYEEIVKPDRDCYDRFPAMASISYKAGVLARPIIDEYVEILWAAMKKVWPNIERKKRKFKMSVSCDVDRPYSPYVKSVPLTIKKLAGDIVKRKNFSMAVKSGLNCLATQMDIFYFEPNHSFEWIMKVNEAAGNKVMFNFMAGQTDPKMDGCYSLDETRIRKLICRIHERGHEIGLHGSYMTYRSAQQHSLEATRLQRIMEQEGIQQDEIGNRQHYLRWSTPETARNLEQAGIDYDTSLGYAELPGFRCGTCHQYSMYDLIERKPLRLQQRPLIIMDDSVVEDDYLGLGYTRNALELILSLKRRAQKFDGNFTLLWHNSNFMNDKARELYTELIN